MSKKDRDRSKRAKRRDDGEPEGAGAPPDGTSSATTTGAEGTAKTSAPDAERTAHDARSQPPGSGAKGGDQPPGSGAKGGDQPPGSGAKGGDQPPGTRDVRSMMLGVASDDPAARATELVPGFDLDGETAYEVAPVAATEYAGALWGPDSAPGSVRTTPTPEVTSVEEIESQIRALEARLDTMIRQREPGATPRPTPAPRAPVAGAALAAPRGIDPDELEQERGVLDTARELLSTDYYMRRWGRMGMRNRSEEVDEFGLDPKYEARLAPFFDFLHRVYFRVDTEGTDHIPATGRCLVVANHSGGPLPYDGIMLRTTVKREHAQRRELRWLAEDFIYYLPFVGAAMSRIGAVRACQENAQRLLDGGNAVAVFPEGAKGIGKLYKDRYRLQRFGRGGFIRLALRTRTPIVPCAIVGAEEANPMLHRVEYMTRALGIPYLPVTPTFPALGPLGLLPAPTKWKVRFGPPVPLDEYGPEAAEDEILVGRLAERVRGTIQTMLDTTLAARQSIWFG